MSHKSRNTERKRINNLVKNDGVKHFVDFCCLSTGQKLLFFPSG